jgi:hypothetical protein
MNELPNELLLHIADELLNPAERSRLSTCNRCLRELLPTSLRVKVVSSRGDGALQPEFFVSPADTDQPTRILTSNDNLRFGCSYHFWTFDYERNNNVYLGRHTRHGHKPDDNGDPQYLYTLGLRPRHPNQTWEVVGGENGDIVMWGEDIGLLGGGENPKLRQPDSDQRGLLSCLPSSSSSTCRSPSWCTLDDEWGQNEKIQLLKCQDFVPRDDVKEKHLEIYAIPEVCDEGEYLLHSPWSQNDGAVGCEGYHVTVNFHFWIHAGLMYFYAPLLPFSLGIPILDTDEDGSPCHIYGKLSPLANLLEIKSARWGCVIYYMAVAADVSEGKSLDMERFLGRVTDHRDHTVVYNTDDQMINIDVCNKKVNTQAPALARDNDAVWKFILSW